MTEHDAATVDELTTILDTHQPDAVTDYTGRPLAAVEIRTTTTGQRIARLRFAGPPIR